MPATSCSWPFIRIWPFSPRRNAWVIMFLLMALGIATSCLASPSGGVLAQASPYLVRGPVAVFAATCSWPFIGILTCSLKYNASIHCLQLLEYGSEQEYPPSLSASEKKQKKRRRRKRRRRRRRSSRSSSSSPNHPLPLFPPRGGHEPRRAGSTLDAGRSFACLKYYYYNQNCPHKFVQGSQIKT